MGSRVGVGLAFLSRLLRGSGKLHMYFEVRAEADLFGGFCSLLGEAYGRYPDKRNSPLDSLDPTRPGPGGAPVSLLGS